MQPQRALLLDKNYVALSIVTLRKAIKLMVNGKAEPVCDIKSVTKIQYSKGQFVVPSVLRLLTTVPWKAHMGHARFSRKNVMIRDNNECQYCGKKVNKNATIDHVIPVSRGGKSEYTNCVTSCHECNNGKANRTPSEAGLKLKHRPKNPSFMTANRTFLDNPPEEWRIYIMGLSGGDNENNI